MSENSVENENMNSETSEPSMPEQTAESYNDVDADYLTDGSPDWKKMHSAIQKYKDDNKNLTARNEGLRRQLSKGSTFENVLNDENPNEVLIGWLQDLSGGQDTKEDLVNAYKGLRSLHSQLSENDRNSLACIFKKAGLSQNQADLLGMVYAKAALGQAKEAIDARNLARSEEYKPKVDALNKTFALANDFLGEQDEEARNRFSSMYEYIKDNPGLIDFFSKFSDGLSRGIEEKLISNQRQSIGVSSASSSNVVNSSINESNYQNYSMEDQCEYLRKAFKGEIKTSMTKKELRDKRIDAALGLKK